MTRTKQRKSTSTLRVEELERRLVLSPVPLVQQSFDSTAPGALPVGWSQWSSGGGAFAVSAAREVSGSDGLASYGASSTTSRAWVTSPQPADIQVSASILVDGLVPAQIILRGSGLNGSSPTYYALTVRRGLAVELSRVVNGASTSLGQRASAAWFSGSWAQLTLSATGGHLQAQVYRADTRQYLNSQGQWQSAQTWVIDAIDSVISGSGDAGVGRAAAYAGTVYFDDFTVAANTPAQAAGQAESFDTTSAGNLPSGWSQWNSGASSFSVSRSRSLSGSESLASSADSRSSGRTWLASWQPADVQASAAVFADSIAPAQVLVRGSNLNSAAPTYYAVSVTRGLSLQLVRVVNGTATHLAGIASATWFEGLWVQVTLSVSGTRLTVQAYRPDTGQFLDAQGHWGSMATAAITYTDAAIAGGGYAGLARPAAYAGTVYLDNFSVVPLNTSPPPPQTGAPSIPQHYSWIRLAQIAYSGMSLGWFEDQLLAHSVDLVITDDSSLSSHITQMAPGTPQMAYINYSSLYGSLLLDWDAYANAHGLSRESAFYHVTQATPYWGDSPSSQPVNWFWAAYLGGATPTFQDVTTQSHTAGIYPITLGGAGQSLYLGYPEEFREINFRLGSGAAAGWSEALEYPTAVDASGNPTAWGTLTTVTDGTARLARSGQITFDPPSNWKAASINGSALMYYVRVRTVTGGRAPVVDTALGRDYTGANGGTSGVIPAFDYSADTNHDGYLSDAEYAHRKPGMNARFAYESRLFYGSYGAERFATNPSSAGFRAWAVDYSQRFLAARPNTAGLFVDNSSGNSQVTAPIRESVATYTADYGSLLAAVGKAVAPHWLLANTVGGGTAADPVVDQGTAYFEEFALRPLTASYLQFEDTAALVAHRASLETPPPYAVLDSLPAGGSPTDPRTQLATLAYYYLLADPSRTFLDLYGGYSPASSWSQHWFGALTYNVGRPTGPWSLFASGLDPGDTRLTYHVYARSYSNALVLYKPLSSTPTGSITGSASNDTATVQQLGGTYRPLKADGTLGAPVTSVTLRNGEGAILIKA
jgi:hypothetical protein